MFNRTLLSNYQYDFLNSTFVWDCISLDRKVWQVKDEIKICKKKAPSLKATGAYE